MREPRILDVTCGSRTIWFQKNCNDAVFCDNRCVTYKALWKSGKNPSERDCTVSPDVVCDFTDLPFADNKFYLVVFDPPHLRQVGDTAWLAKKYGKLGENWQQMIHDGFRECMRVLKPNGVLIFKWSEYQIPTREVIDAIGSEPLFGHRSGKRSLTHWMCFIKDDGSCAPVARKIIRKRFRSAQYIYVSDDGHGNLVRQWFCGTPIMLEPEHEYSVEVCSRCEKRLDDTFQNYCPNCGARIVEDDDGDLR